MEKKKETKKYRNFTTEGVIFLVVMGLLFAFIVIKQITEQSAPAQSQEESQVSENNDGEQKIALITKDSFKAKYGQVSIVENMIPTQGTINKIDLTTSEFSLFEIVVVGKRIFRIEKGKEQEISNGPFAFFDTLKQDSVEGQTKQYLIASGYLSYCINASSAFNSSCAQRLGSILLLQEDK